MASHVMKPGQSFPAGTVVSVYEDLGETRRDGPPSTPVITTATVTANSVLTFTGLEYGTRYWAVAQVAVRWTWIGFATDEASTNQLAGDLTALDGQVQVIREAPLNVQYPEFAGGAKGDGSTDDASAFAAVAAKAGTKGSIFCPPGNYRVSSLPSFKETVGVTLQGAGGENAGSTAATCITYTGSAARALDARSSYGFKLRDIQLVYSNASFTGTLVDLSHSVSQDAAFAGIRDCYLGGAGISTAGTLVLLANAISLSIRDTNLARGQVLVKGRTTGGDYSNAITLDNCKFHLPSVAAVQAAGQAWTIINGTFEPSASGGAKGYAHGGIGANGVSFVGGWFGDTDGTGTWIDYAGNGLVVNGAYISGSAKGIALGGSSFGAHIAANEFSNMTTGVDVAAGCTGITVDPSNTFASVTNRVVAADTAFGSVFPNGTIREVRGIPAAGVYRSTNQSIPDVTATAVTWDSEEFDQQGLHSGSSSRLTAPITGVFSLTAFVPWAANATSYRQASLRVNGVAVANSNLNAGSATIQQSLSTVVKMAAGDYAELFLSQATGGSLDILGGSGQSRMAMAYLGS